MITDHTPQEKLLSSKGAPTPRIQRWLLKMQPYDYTIQYEPEHKNPGDSYQDHHYHMRPQMMTPSITLMLLIMQQQVQYLLTKLNKSHIKMTH